MLKATRHVGIVVKDMDKMVAFYRDFLELQAEIDFHEKGAFIDTVQNLEGVDLRMVKLALPDGSLIELLCDQGHPLQDLDRRQLCDAGIVHVAFTVEDIEETHQAFTSRGLKTLSDPVTSPDGKARLFFARDPEGNLMELVEMLPSPRTIHLEE